MSIPAWVALISIHVPREGDDRPSRSRKTRSLRFQSTSPVRGTTWGAVIYFTLPPISIHVPREGDDLNEL